MICMAPIWRSLAHSLPSLTLGRTCFHIMESTMEKPTLWGVEALSQQPARIPELPRTMRELGSESFSLACCYSVTKSWLGLLFKSPWTTACQASLSFTISRRLLKLVSFELILLSNNLILCHPLLLLPSIFPSIRVFSSESALASGDQSIGISASVLPMNIQGWFPWGWTGLIFLQSKGLSGVFSNTIRKHQFFGIQPSLWSNSHSHTWLLEKP